MREALGADKGMMLEGLTGPVPRVEKAPIVSERLIAFSGGPAADGLVQSVTKAISSRFRPNDLARYKALSADLKRASKVAFCSLRLLIPMLAV